MDADQTLRLSALTCARRLSDAAYRHPAGQLCLGGPSSTRKCENCGRAASELTREGKNYCGWQVRTRVRRPEDDLNRAHHSFVGRLRLFWD